jgi:AcrR family transcriptional regulator
MTIMMRAEEVPEQIPGLRERKKFKTRAMIEEHALRLFVEQGYEATTVEQIAEAAEVSQSTFFRYFPAKENLILSNLPNAIVIELFGTQAQELTPLQAMRSAIRELQSNMSIEEFELLKTRFKIIHSVSELKSLAIKEFVGLYERFSELVANRVGKKPDDFDVIVFAGAIIGVWIAVVHTSKMTYNLEEFPTRFEKALERLGDGLPFN